MKLDNKSTYDIRGNLPDNDDRTIEKIKKYFYENNLPEVKGIGSYEWYKRFDFDWFRIITYKGDFIDLSKT